MGSPSFLSLSPESVTVRIDWENLPSSFEFADYYAGYGVPVENASYQVAASVLSAGRWIPLSLPDRSLFRREPESPCLVSEFTLTPPKQARKISESAKPLVYDASVTEGFVRLELTAPDFGFGAARYAQAVSETVLKNAADRESRPMPNPPLTPLAKGISVFLNAEGSWHVADAGLLILHPFLSALWERAGIAGFKGGEADHFLAVSLMLYLAWGEGYQARRASPFLKLLAGLPAESVLPPPVPLGNAETALCNSLLAAVVERWDVLKNSSLEALREAFLQRVGRLRRGQDRYDLTVERKTFDVLMDKIPWSYSVLFSPWMERPVHVRW
ncbi:MAG TPA: contractile injection system tape measure protein [bacterium]|nr:contractile injection system tape measure protein [bacterium]